MVKFTYARISCGYARVSFGYVRDIENNLSSTLENPPASYLTSEWTIYTRFLYNYLCLVTCLPLLMDTVLPLCRIGGGVLPQWPSYSRVNMHQIHGMTCLLLRAPRHIFPSWIWWPTFDRLPPHLMRNSRRVSACVIYRLHACSARFPCSGCEHFEKRHWWRFSPLILRSSMARIFMKICMSRCGSREEEKLLLVF